MFGHVAAERGRGNLKIEINKTVIDDLYNATIIPLMPMWPHSYVCIPKEKEHSYWSLVPYCQSDPGWFFHYKIAGDFPLF